MHALRQQQVGRATIRLFDTGAGYTGVVLIGRRRRAVITDPDPEALWRRLHLEAARRHPEFRGFDGARDRFLQVFPEGFRSPAYLERERNPKMAAKAGLDAAVRPEAASEASGMAEPVLAAYRATDLLSPFEKARVQEMLRGPGADRFIRAAADFTLGETARGLREMEHALRPHRAARWTAVTYLPFLWRPDRHMFLKPQVTRDFAERVGHRFHREYRPRLDGTVYDSLLDLAAATERALEPLHPRDRIDVQSFVWVVGEYPADPEAGAP